MPKRLRHLDISSTGLLKTCSVACLSTPCLFDTGVDESAVATLVTLEALEHLDIRLADITANSIAFIQLRLPRCTILAEEMCVV